jgi:hypothetical protein
VTRVLGIAVGDALVRDWQSWLAPAVQPFFVESASDWPAGVVADHDLSPELRDTYKTWRMTGTRERVWLDEAAFLAMSRADRTRLVRAQVECRRGAVPTVRGWSDLVDPARLRSQADGHRFVWWPSLVATNAEAILQRAVASDLPASRHAEVPARVWTACAAVLPGAQSVAGSFPEGSGPNCFGTVVAAAGVDGAAREWLVDEPFQKWLDATCRSGGDDRAPGTVLVWRSAAGLPVHAAVTIGEGWVLEKPSQEWSSPRAVVTIDDARRLNRARGQRLERHHIVGDEN